MREVRMRPEPSSTTARIGAASLPLPMDVRLARRGGRAFVARALGGDITVTLPEVTGPAQVLVPRGFGHPLLGRVVGGQLRAEPAGEPCAPARWVPVGGVAAWLREIPMPRGPTRAIAPVAHRPGTGPWICIHPVATQWSALRLREPAMGRGPVAVAERWVLAASPAARARGVFRGMSVRLARRRCPGLVIRPPVAGIDLVEEVERRVGQWLGVASRSRGRILARLPDGVVPGPTALAWAERLARLLWQELGVEVRTAVANTAEAAVGLAGWLEAGWAAVAAGDAGGAWAARASMRARVTAGGGNAAWQGAPTPDLEGVVARAQGLAAGLSEVSRGGVLQVRVQGERGRASLRLRVPEGCGRTGLANLVGNVVRRQAAGLGAVHGVILASVAEGAVAPPPHRAEAARAERAVAAAGGGGGARRAVAGETGARGPGARAEAAGGGGALLVAASGDRGAPRPRRAARQLALLPRVR
jgi:hypothetical protein